MTTTNKIVANAICSMNANLPPMRDWTTQKPHWSGRKIGDTLVWTGWLGKSGPVKAKLIAFGEGRDVGRYAVQWLEDKCGFHKGGISDVRSTEF